MKLSKTVIAQLETIVNGNNRLSLRLCVECSQSKGDENVREMPKYPALRYVNKNINFASVSGSEHREKKNNNKNINFASVGGSEHREILDLINYT